MVNIQKNKDKELRNDKSPDKKHVVKRTEKNPLKIKLSSDKDDKRKARRDFFTDKASGRKRRESSTERIGDKQRH